MTAKILTLFGEEIVPEQVKPAAKARTAPVKEQKEAQKATEEKQEAEPVAVPAENNESIAVLKDWQPEKQYYSIGEVAGLFDVRTSHIRFWTKEFNLKVRTTRKGDRLYSPEHILQLRNIYHLLKERHFTIKGAKAKLREDKKPSATATDLKQSLLQLRNRLQEIRDRMA